MAMRVGKALNCSILEECDFSRKNYFYPDLDKAYQITQYDLPLAEWGKTPDRRRRRRERDPYHQDSILKKIPGDRCIWAQQTGGSTP